MRLVLLVTLAAANPKDTHGAESSFVDVTQSLGIDFEHDSGLSGLYRLPEVMGSGLAVFDYDADDDLDLYFVGGVPGSSRLYRRNNRGEFDDVTREAGLDNPGQGMGTALGDIDNDGDLDLYLTNVGRDRLQRNDGNGTFTDVTARSGIDVHGWSSSATFCDVNADGFLDLFVATYVTHDLPADEACSTASGQRDYCPPNVYRSLPNRLYQNRGDGTFLDVTNASGLKRLSSPALGVVCTDVDGNGHPDIFVANDGTANHLWLNRGDGTFDEGGLLWGAAFNLFGEAEAGMGVALGDANADGLLDLFVTHIDGETNTLYTKAGAKAMVDATIRSKLGPPSLPHTGFGAVFLDMDHDGDLDLAVANGRVRRRSGVPGLNQTPLTRERFTAVYGEGNHLSVNTGNGTFAGACGVSTFCSATEVSRGLLAADLDRDGDQDLILTNANGPARIFDNRAPKRGRWLQVRLRDRQTRRDAVGAVLQIRVGERWIVRPVIHSSSYLASTEATVHVGLGDVRAVDDIVVIWPGAARERFTIDGLDRYVELYKGQGQPVASRLSP